MKLYTYKETIDTHCTEIQENLRNLHKIDLTSNTVMIKNADKLFYEIASKESSNLVDAIFYHHTASGKRRTLVINEAEKRKIHSPIFIRTETRIREPSININ
ncbi:hypothetical protein AN639_07885 [Candidatus Epulonipiscium fishelsonii]|uniref:Uncharacterized protein n=1 Tax=Candidatus Epulonipiscium fishelsonii TaxID=77094 RepID=A0ACC8X8K1_9FIRM|nr:hypothetical protein AN396_11075 [Epulopiscium sp. SCG-B11WGA-EpuloA1]ONI38415.1 hypothetical protein AN639_07885 [Epulopiscium sp. SCG-B05WGA-EpuloA1]